MHAYYVDFGAFWYIKSNIICVQRTSLYSLKKKKYRGYYLFGVHVSVLPASSLSACNVLTQRNENKQGEQSRRRCETYLFVPCCSSTPYDANPSAICFIRVPLSYVHTDSPHGPIRDNGDMPPVVSAHWSGTRFTEKITGSRTWRCPRESADSGTSDWTKGARAGHHLFRENRWDSNKDARRG